MGGKSEEIKVVISANTGSLNRELTASEKAVLQAKGLIQDYAGKIRGASSAWKSYRTAAVTELNRAQEAVKKQQAKVAELKEKMDKRPVSSLPDQDIEQWIKASKASGWSDAAINEFFANERKRAASESGENGNLDEQYEQATAQLKTYQKAAEEATTAVEQLNEKVAESSSAESAQKQEMKSATQQAKEQARAAMESTKAHAANARETANGRSGLAKFGMTAAAAIVGARTLYAGLRKLATSMLEAAKADSSLSSSLGQIKGNLGIAFQGVYQAALPALRALASIISAVTNAIAQLVSYLGGVGWGKASGAAQDYAKSVGGAGGAAKKAAQQMMAIDELNVMNADDSSGGGGGGGLAAIFGQPIDFSWMDGVQARIDRIKAAASDVLTSLKSLGATLAESFRAAWKEGGKGEKLLGTIERIITNTLGIVGNLAGRFREAWAENENGKRIWSGLIGTFTEAFGVAEDVTAEINGWSETANFGPLVEGWANFTESIETFVKSVRESLQPIWESFIGPALDEGLNLSTRITNFAAAAVNAVTMIVTAFMTIVNTVAISFKAVYDIIRGTPVPEALGTWAESMRTMLGNAAENVNEAFSQCGENMMAALGDGIDSNKSAVERPLGRQKTYISETVKDITASAAELPRATSEATAAVAEALASTPTAEAAKELGASLASSLAAGIKENATLPVTEMQTMAQQVMQAFTTGFSGASGAGGTAGGATGGLFSSILTSLEEIAQPVATKALEISSSVKLELFTFMTWFNESFVAPIKAQIVLLMEEIYNETDYRLGEVETVYEALKKAANADLLNMQGVAQGAASALQNAFTTACAEATAKIASVKSALDALDGRIVKVTIKITTEGSIPKFGGGCVIGLARGGIVHASRGGIIPAAASGGRFDRGQLFVAREAGPELVAGIGGGRTAVMNNNQIVKAVSEGVYAAVVDAMSIVQGGEQGDIILMLNDREIARAARRGEKAMGYRISANPAF